MKSFSRRTRLGHLELENQTRSDRRAGQFLLVWPFVNHFKSDMRILTVSLALLATSALAFADIQAPPASDQGPTRKLGRGIGNIAFGITEIPFQLSLINDLEGNAAAWSYGLVRGTGRVLARLGFGIYEVALFPFPTHKGTYYPPYRSDIPWINSGYSEFPPELGFETRYDYSRIYPDSY
jgi:putative exosortase-associated protein (TIGR04073 family)